MVGIFRQNAHIERRTGKTVLTAVGAGEHVHATHSFPVVGYRQLLVIRGSIGQHLILLAFMDGDFAVDIFHYGAVAGVIADGHMQRGGGAAGHLRCIDLKTVGAERFHRFVRGREIIEHISGPQSRRHVWPRVVIRSIECAGKIQEVAHQPHQSGKPSVSAAHLGIIRISVVFDK